jgi:putative zinc finger/helix-turn-helix YgiT family protein
MRCPNCKKADLRSWEGETKLMGVAVFSRGEKCPNCSEVVIGSSETKRLEKAAAKEIAERGARTGAEIKFLRKVAGLTAAELAALLSVDVMTVSRWETEKIEMPRAAQLALSLLVESPRITRERLERLAKTA